MHVFGVFWFSFSVSIAKTNGVHFLLVMTAKLGNVEIDIVQNLDSMRFAFHRNYIMRSLSQRVPLFALNRCPLPLDHGRLTCTDGYGCCPQTMDNMLDQVELACEVSFTLDGVIDKVEGETDRPTAPMATTTGSACYAS